jgi:hypothetical protein
MHPVAQSSHLEVVALDSCCAIWTGDVIISASTLEKSTSFNTERDILYMFS